MTRKTRLEFALELDKHQEHEYKWSAMEIMVGRRVDSQEGQYAMLYMIYELGGMDARKFYEGFPNSEKE